MKLNIQLKKIRADFSPPVIKVSLKGNIVLTFNDLGESSALRIVGAGLIL
jgi:hypothetical protein